MHSDRDHLRLEQYGDSTNLNARYELHARFSTNRYGWHPWVFDQLSAPSNGRILEVGCGPGFLWNNNAERIPADWRLTLSDFSPGMVRAARQSLSSFDASFDFVVFDVQAIPVRPLRIRRCHRESHAISRAGTAGRRTPKSDGC